MIKTDNTDTTYTYIDLDHFMKVAKARAKLGLEKSDNAIRNVEINDHPLIGKHIYRHSSKKWYKIEKVNKQWWAGFYYGMLIQNNGSHAFLYFENVNSICEVIIEACQECQTDFDWNNIK